MKKVSTKICVLLIATIVLLLALTTMVNAETETAKELVTESGLTYTVDEYGYAQITGTTKTDAKTLEIPSKIGEHIVDEIEESAFAGNKNLEKVVITTGRYMTIENKAFSGCTNLKEVEFKLGEGEAHGCGLRVNVFEGTAIETLKFNKGVYGPFAGVFNGMTKLKRIYFEHTDIWLADYNDEEMLDGDHRLDEATEKYFKENVTIYGYSTDEDLDSVNNVVSLTPKGFADKHGIKFVDLAELVENTLGETEVTVKGKMEKEAKLVVKKLEETSEVYKSIVTGLEGYKVLSAHEISIIDGKYEGNITVTIEVGTGHDGESALVLHKKADGTIEKFEPIIKDGKVMIQVTELSPFVVAVKENTTETNPKPQTQQQQTTTTNTTPKPAEQTKPESELDESPKTGVEDMNVNVLGIAMISLLGIVVLKKNK